MMGELQFPRIACHQAVEMGDRATCFRPQNPPQPLGFFLSRPERPGHLNEHIRIRQIDGKVAYFREDQPF